MIRQAGRVSVRFQRGEGRAKVKKTVRKFPLRARHILLLLGGSALFFFAAFELYSFAITWPKFEVCNVLVACPDPSVRSMVQETAGAARWGNILLLDLDRARRDVESNPWVKEARTRKVFPAGLAIEVIPRRPAALLDKESLFLIDEEGAVIEQAGRTDLPNLPVFTDAGRFVLDCDLKVKRAFACLNDLPASVRERVDALDLSDPSDVVLRFRGSRTRLYLGDDLFAARVADYCEREQAWRREAGELDYVILWHEDRIVYRPFAVAPAPLPGGGAAKPSKETN
ncbi:MAG: FtsQ-type POTRA domain-containing protein [Candidatus Aminicenantales bacterium]|jgi:cell division septal protein FtsQ